MSINARTQLDSSPQAAGLCSCRAGTRDEQLATAGRATAARARARAAVAPAGRARAAGARAVRARGGAARAEAAAAGLARPADAAATPPRAPQPRRHRRVARVQQPVCTQPPGCRWWRAAHPAAFALAACVPSKHCGRCVLRMRDITTRRRLSGCDSARQRAPRLVGALRHLSAARHAARTCLRTRTPGRAPWRFVRPAHHGYCPAPAAGCG